MESYGPFEKYAEVDTSRGVFGLQPGQILEFGEGGEILRYDAVESIVFEADSSEEE